MSSSTPRIVPKAALTTRFHRDRAYSSSTARAIERVRLRPVPASMYPLVSPIQLYPLIAHSVQCSDRDCVLFVV